MPWILLAFAIAVIDQYTKHLVTVNIGYGEKLSVIDDFFYITFHENKGAAWGMFQNATIYLIIIGIAATAVMVFVLFKFKNRLFRLSLSFVLGGAAGNLVDRIFKGAVTDFLDFHFWSYNYPTFNVADSFIVIGGILLAYYLLFVYKEA